MSKVNRSCRPPPKVEVCRIILREDPTLTNKQVRAIAGADFHLYHLDQHTITDARHTLGLSASPDNVGKRPLPPGVDPPPAETNGSHSRATMSPENKPDVGQMMIDAILSVGRQITSCNHLHYLVHGIYAATRRKPPAAGEKVS